VCLALHWSKRSGGIKPCVFTKEGFHLQTKLTVEDMRLSTWRIDHEKRSATKKQTQKNRDQGKLRLNAHPSLRRNSEKKIWTQVSATIEEVGAIGREKIRECREKGGPRVGRKKISSIFGKRKIVRGEEGN